MKHGHSSD